MDRTLYRVHRRLRARPGVKSPLLGHIPGPFTPRAVVHFIGGP